MLAILAPNGFAYQRPNSVLLNHVSHPATDLFKPIITKSYQDIGINVEYVSMTSERGIISVNSGLIDGDVIRVEKAVEEFPAIITVKPRLTRVNFYLICAQNRPCDNTVLASNVAIFASKRSITLLSDYLPASFSGELVEIDRIAMIPELIKKKRGDYGIYGSTVGRISTDISLNFQSYLIDSFDSYHIIHEKHAPLIPELERAIQKNLNAVFDKNINH